MDSNTLAAIMALVNLGNAIVSALKVIGRKAHSKAKNVKKASV